MSYVGEKTSTSPSLRKVLETSDRRKRRHRIQVNRLWTQRCLSVPTSHSGFRCHSTEVSHLERVLTKCGSGRFPDAGCNVRKDTEQLWDAKVTRLGTDSDGIY